MLDVIVQADSPDHAQTVLQRLEEDTLLEALRSHGIHDRAHFLTPPTQQQTLPASNYLLHSLSVTPAAKALQGYCRRMLVLNDSSNPNAQQIFSSSASSASSIVNCTLNQGKGEESILPASCMRPSGPCIVDAEMIDDQGATLSLDMSQSILRRSPRLLGDRVNSSPHSPRLDNTPPEIFQDYDGPLFKTTPKVQSFMTLVTPQSLGSNLLAALEDSRPNGAAPMAGTSSVASNPLLQKAEESLTASSNGKESSTASSNGADLAATSGTTSKRLHQSKHSMTRSSTRGGAGGGSGAANAGGAAVVPAGEGDEVEQNKNKLTSKAPSTVTEDGALLSERLVSDSRATGAEEGGAGHRKMSRTEREKHSSRGGVSRKIDTATAIVGTVT